MRAPKQRTTDECPFAQLPSTEGQLGQPTHLRAGYVGRQPDRGDERQLHEPGSDAEGLGRSPGHSGRRSGNRIVLRRQ
jgi:hypothetical protein